MVSKLILLKNILFLVLLGEITSGDNSLFSVTSFPDIERFYVRAKKQGLGQQFVLSKPVWRTTSPNNICECILDTVHFRHRDIYPIDLRDPRIQIEIRIFYPRLFRVFYQIEKGDTGEVQTVYTLPYVERTVRVFNRTAREEVVTCLARVSKTYSIRQFFVSSPYQAYKGAEDENMYFVFRAAGHSLPDEVVIEALAEEAALASNKLTRVEMSYLNRRWEIGSKPTTRPEADPLCSLSLSIKLRICVSILSSERFRGELEFVPVEENVQQTCFMRDVFLYGLSKRGGSVYESEGLSEWMFGCDARIAGSIFRTITLFVSRGYDSKNSVFVYKLVNGRFEMVDYLRNIRALHPLHA